MGEMNKLRRKVIMPQGLSALSRYASVQHLFVLPICVQNFVGLRHQKFSLEICRFRYKIVVF